MELLLALLQSLPSLLPLSAGRKLEMAEMQFLLHLGMEQIPLPTPVIPAAITPLVMADAQFGFATGRTVGYIVWRVIISL